MAPPDATVPPAPRTAHHHGDLRQALVAAGIELLDEGGLAALTLRRCAARAGVSHAAPAHHFKGLRGLLTAIVAPFVGFLAAIYYCWTVGWMGWPFLAMLVIGWMISGSGVTIGFHRLLTHSSFETYRPLRAIWMMMGALSVEGSPLVWCAVHRRHHAKSDQRGDPHSPRVGQHPNEP